MHLWMGASPKAATPLLPLPPAHPSSSFLQQEDASIKPKWENMPVQPTTQPICAARGLHDMHMPLLPVSCLLPTTLPQSTYTKVPTLSPMIMSSTMPPIVPSPRISYAPGMPGLIPLDTPPLCPPIAPVTPSMEPSFSAGHASAFAFMHTWPESTSLKHGDASLASSFKRRRGRPRKAPLPDKAALERAIKTGKPLQEALQMTTGPPLKSRLRPPKQPLTSWQLYFMDEFDKFKASSYHESMNVAKLSSEAGQRYANLPDDVKQSYVQRGQEAREKYEKELAAWHAQLTPEDIRLENQFRAAQRRLGKSRRGNMRDPNAPKRPPPAYFLFLRTIRMNPDLRRDVFHDEHDSLKQSALASAKWRSMSPEEKRPFYEQAEREKAEYVRQRREYEESHTKSKDTI